MEKDKILEAASIISRANHLVFFTGAGLSVESGVPPFRGKDGLWEVENPLFLDLSFFKEYPEICWKKIKANFYDRIKGARPNEGHFVIAEMEKKGRVHSVITQNFDYLHQIAGSEKVIDFHGTIQKLHCLGCSQKYSVDEIILDHLPPRCPECEEILKPDIVFFGEIIPQDVHRFSFEEAERTDVMLLVGTTGVIMPAALVPRVAKDAGAKIIEINVSETMYTTALTDIFLQGKASAVLQELAGHVR